MRVSSLLLLVLAQATVAIAADAPTLMLRDVRACLPLPDGGVLAGTSGGLVHLDPALAIRRSWGPADGLPSATVHTLAEQGDTLWVGTGAGLVRARRVAGRLELAQVFASAPVRAALPHPAGVLVATWGDGVLQLDAERGALVRLGMARPGPRPPAGWSSRAVGLATTGGRFFAALVGHGLYEIRGGALVRVPVELPAIMALGAHEGALYAGTLGGVYRVDGDVATRVQDVDARWLTSGPDGLLAATYGAGAVRIDGRRATPLHEGARFANAVTQRHGATCVGGRDGSSASSSLSSPAQSHSRSPHDSLCGSSQGKRGASTVAIDTHKANTT